MKSNICQEKSIDKISFVVYTSQGRRKENLLYMSGGSVEYMEKIVRQALLYDFYGELLTEHQKSIYSDIVQNDLSYSEVARDEGISRQGVFDLVKRCDKILEDYESKLQLVEKFLDTKERVNRIHELATELKAMTDRQDLKEKMNEIELISKAIYESY